MQPRVDTADTQPRETVASYATYAEAQQAVDSLSDAGFPVEVVVIVGHDVQLVERVTGRLTNARAAGAGAASGAWFGLFIGLLVGLFTTGPEWIGLVVGGLLIGAFWGALFGFFAHYATSRAARFLVCEQPRRRPLRADRAERPGPAGARAARRGSIDDAPRTGRLTMIFWRPGRAAIDQAHRRLA